MFKNKCLILFVSLFFILSLGMVYASDDISQEIDVNLEEAHIIDSAVDNPHQAVNTHIEINNVNSYYKEKSQLVCYLKDDNGVSIPNKQLNISLNGKTYSKVTDLNGQVKLDLNLKPNSYNVAVDFRGDDDFNESNSNSQIKINKAPLVIKTSNFKTNWHSDLFFKAKVYNKVTNNPASGINVLFKVYSLKTKKYTNYYRATDNKGIVTLNKNLKVGSYIIYTYIKDKNHVYSKNSKSKASVTVKPTEEVGCCSYYVQVNGTDSISGYRRDSTYSVTIYFKNVKWYGRTAVKQYKTIGQYSFHMIVTSDGWMVGTGGADSASINKAIEKLSGEMVKSGKIQNNKLKTIKNYISRLGIGHFAIKAPNGKYAAVWLNGIKTGKLKAGEFISVPNYKSCFRTGNYASFNKNPEKAGLKIAATDPYGLNKREISLYHWKSTTKNFKTTSSVVVYAANDNGKYSGLPSKAHLKDDIYFKGKFISKNTLPYTLNMKLLGTHSFGNIDKLIKKSTIINAPNVTNAFNTSEYFKLSVKDKNTKKVVSGVCIKIKITTSSFTKYFTVKTNSKGIAKINTKELAIGNYAVTISPNNNKYLISAKSTIIIK
ncbi:hypothetical protein [Methanobrevibacter sp.]|uniref:hypothetical protein n=1 Tax=Methanobrevibacter sp. TaxID=66852 RepID=UPI0038907784